MIKLLFGLASAILMTTTAQAESLSCKYISNDRQYEEGFLFGVSVQLLCDGKGVELIADNRYVSCKPQFTLANFIDHLKFGERIKLEVTDSTISDVGGGHSSVTFVTKARSESGQILRPQILKQKGKSVKCNTTQIEVW